MTREGQMTRRMETKPGKQIAAYDDDGERHVLGDAPELYVEDKDESSSEGPQSDGEDPHPFDTEKEWDFSRLGNWIEDNLNVTHSMATRMADAAVAVKHDDSNGE